MEKRKKISRCIWKSPEQREKQTEWPWPGQGKQARKTHADYRRVTRGGNWSLEASMGFHIQTQELVNGEPCAPSARSKEITSFGG